MPNTLPAVRLRLATYNIHKARGVDGRVRPDRIVQVLGELDADVIALQEVVSRHGKRPQDHQARYIAEALGFHMELGENRVHDDGAYGNVLLSRYPFHYAHNYDISVGKREPRGCLRADLRLAGGALLHVFNMHLGTSFFERRHQARKLFRNEILTGAHLSGNKILLGDLNEWTRGLASRMLCRNFHRARIGKHIPRRSYPGVFPVLDLDHIYFDSDLQLVKVMLHRGLTALMASDHLPLVADFSIPNAAIPQSPRDSHSNAVHIFDETRHARTANLA